MMEADRLRGGGLRPWSGSQLPRRSELCSADIHYQRAVLCPAGRS
jgi:hypothetical protein